MQKKLLCGLATLGFMANSAFADKVIADFADGTATAFSSYSFGYGDGYAGNEGAGGFFSFNYALEGTTDDNQALYQISVNDGSDALKPTPDFPITDCTGGFSYRYKGAAHIFVTELSTVTDYNVFKTATKPAQANWTLTTVTPANLAQEEGWGTAKTFSLNDITILKWVISNKVTSVATSGTLDIDDITCLTGGGGEPPIPSSGNGYPIFAYSADSEDGLTAFGDYIWGNAYNEATSANPTNAEGMIVFDEGVAKLKNVTLAAPAKYSGAMLGIENGTTKKVADCTEGISYYYKGDPHWFLLEFPKSECSDPTKADDNKWGRAVTPAATTWTKVFIDVASLKLARTWTGAGCGNGNVDAIPVDLSKVTQITWTFDDNVSGAKKDLMIADVICYTASGDPVADSKPAESITINTGDIGTSSIHGAIIPAIGLTVTTHNRALHISSDRDAKISLYTLSGQRVLSSTVSAGNKVFSLMSQNPGVYYAVVQAGTQKQTVKVTIMK